MTQEDARNGGIVVLDSCCRSEAQFDRSERFEYAVRDCFDYSAEEVQPHAFLAHGDEHASMLPRMAAFLKEKATQLFS